MGTNERKRVRAVKFKKVAVTPGMRGKHALMQRGHALRGRTKLLYMCTHKISAREGPHLHVALRAKVVNLIRPRDRDDMAQVGRVRQVAVVQEQT